MIKASQAVLGLCMREPRNLDQVLGLGLSPVHFEDVFERDVFAAMVEAEREGKPFDLVALGLQFAGAAVRLVSFCEDAPVAQNPKFYVDALINRHWRLDAQRQLMALLAQLQHHDDFHGIRSIQDAALSLAERLAQGAAVEVDLKNMTVILTNVLNDLEDSVNAHRQQQAIALTTGLKGLDYAIGGGWRRKRMASLCARSGKGKTTLGLCFARTAILEGARVVYFSTEAGPEELVEKILANDAMVNAAKLVNGSITDDEMDRFAGAVERLHKTHLVIDDRSSRDIDRLEASLRRQKRKAPVDLVIVDYVQQVRDSSTRSAHRPQEVANVTARLKALAMDLDVPVVVLAQLNRTVDKGDSFPALGDIADSSAIEKDSDHVLILHWLDDGPSSQRPILRIAKNRLGVKDYDIRLDANLAFCRFTEASR